MNFWTLFLEMWYVLVGFLLIDTAYISYSNIQDNRKYIAGLFWLLLGIIFIIGPYIPYAVSGFIIIIIGILSFTKSINVGDIEQIDEKFRDQQSGIIGGKIFIPSLIIAAGAFIFSTVLPNFAGKQASASQIGFIAIGLSALIGLVTALIITKSPSKNVVTDGSRILRTMGSLSILPQLLGALGAVFTAAGVGDLIAKLLGSVISDQNVFLGVVAYCVGMALFTMIMGNAFAAFTVITVGIGIPFVFANGANPVIASALAMTAGFCGTLMTPMAANFNLLPATLLESKSQYSVIKFQVPFAIILLIIHIFLMYFLAFNF